MTDTDIMRRFFERLKEGEEKHPDFAEGQYQALGFLSEEHGEVAKEISKGLEGWQERSENELLDLMVVAYRMLRHDYEHEV